MGGVVVGGGWGADDVSEEFHPRTGREGKTYTSSYKQDCSSNRGVYGGHLDLSTFQIDHFRLDDSLVRAAYDLDSDKPSQPPA